MKSAAIIVATRGGGGGGNGGDGGGSARGGGGLHTTATCHKRLVAVDLSLHPYEAKADRHAGLSPVMLRFRRTQTRCCNSHHASHGFVGHPGYVAHSAGTSKLREKGGVGRQGFYPDACSSQRPKLVREGKRERSNATMPKTHVVCDSNLPLSGSDPKRLRRLLVVSRRRSYSTTSVRRRRALRPPRPVGDYHLMWTSVKA